MLYRLTTGELPFKGNTTMAVLTSLAVDEPVSVRQLNPKVPEALAQLIRQLLSKSAADRPRTAADVAMRLEEIQKGATNNDKPLVSKVEYVPLAVSVITEDVWAGIDDQDAPTAPMTSAKKKSTITPVVPAAKPKPRDSKKKPLGLFVAMALGGLFVLAGAAAIVIKITNKDGSVTELKVPDDAKIEVNGKNVTPEKPKTPVKLDPLPPWNPPAAIAIGDSPFDKLDRNAIPKEERFAWQPGELVAVIGTHARRHWSAVTSVAFSPDGKLAATGSNGLDHIILWDMATQTVKHRLPWMESGASAVGSLQFSQDGTKIFVGIHGGYAALRIADLSGTEPKWVEINSNGKKSTEWIHGAGSRTNAFENGNTLATSNMYPGPISLFDWNNGTPKLVTEKFPVTGFPVFVPQTNQMIYASPEGKLRRATIKNAKFVDDVEIPIPLEPKEWPRAVSEDGKTLALWAKDHLELWEIAGLKPIKRLDINSKQLFSGMQYSLSLDGRWLSANYVSIALWRIDGPEPKFAGWLDQTNLSVDGYGAVFSTDGKRAVAATGEGFVRFWDLGGAEPKELSPLEPAKGYVLPNWITCPQIDPRTNRLMLQTFDPPKTGRQRYQLWDFASTTPRQMPSAETPLDAKYGRLFPISQDRWVQNSALSGERFHRYEIRDNRWQMVGEPFGEPETVATVSADGKWMFLLSGTKPDELKLHGWDVSGEPVRRWEVPVQSKKDGGFVHSQVFSSAQGTVLAVWPVSEAPSELRIYRNTGSKPELTGTIAKKNSGLYRAAISPDGRTLAHTRDVAQVIVLEDISSGDARRLSSIGDKSMIGNVQWLAFSPDGRQLAYANTTGVGVLDAKTLKPIYIWIRPGPVHWVDWAPDGRHLLTLNGNKTVYVLRLNEFVVTADRKAAE